jgi:hypothetical protein
MSKGSLNLKSVAAGNAYPLFYDTLFADLRDTFTTAVEAARSAGKGLWKADRSTAGLTVIDEDTLKQNGVIYPKVFRRLTSYFDGGGAGLIGFLSWL